MCHPDPVGFHGMPLAIVVVPNITLEKLKFHYVLNRMYHI